jgi:arsenate reductase
MKNILVLCTGNSCRSQIAEGFIRHYFGKSVHVYSAGIETHGVNPRAIATMAEVGIDISKHTSNHVDEYLDIPFDLILTVCDHAAEQCPVFPSNAHRLHENFPDPAKAQGSEMEIKAAFQHTRNLIDAYCKNVLQPLINAEQ